jgi:hypothetical protein
MHHGAVRGQPDGRIRQDRHDIIICGMCALCQVDEQAEAVSDVHEVVG